MAVWSLGVAPRVPTLYVAWQRSDADMAPYCELRVYGATGARCFRNPAGQHLRREGELTG
jgi:hypothetical protein